MTITTSTMGVASLGVPTAVGIGTSGAGCHIGTPSVTNTIDAVDYPYPIDPDVLGCFKIRKIDNGFLVQASRQIGEIATTRYAKDMLDIGEMVVAWLVEQRLEK